MVWEIQPGTTKGVKPSKIKSGLSGKLRVDNLWLMVDS